MGFPGVMAGSGGRTFNALPRLSRLENSRLVILSVALSAIASRQHSQVSTVYGFGGSFRQPAFVAGLERS
jgi:hypothetical protein